MTSGMPITLPPMTWIQGVTRRSPGDVGGAEDLLESAGPKKTERGGRVVEGLVLVQLD
jgi:hypothetical protein